MSTHTGLFHAKVRLIVVISNYTYYKNVLSQPIETGKHFKERKKERKKNNRLLQKRKILNFIRI